MVLTNKTLFNIASGGALVMMGMSAYVIRRMENVYKDSSFFKDAMDIMEAHEGVKTFLGTNLYASRVQPEPSEEESPVAAFTAKISGSKSSGQMFFWAEKKVDGENIKIEITRIELELENDKSKRLVVSS